MHGAGKARGVSERWNILWFFCCFLPHGGHCQLQEYDEAWLLVLVCLFLSQPNFDRGIRHESCHPLLHEMIGIIQILEPRISLHESRSRTVPGNLICTRELCAHITSRSNVAKQKGKQILDGGCEIASNMTAKANRTQLVKQWTEAKHSNMSNVMQGNRQNQLKNHHHQKS